MPPVEYRWKPGQSGNPGGNGEAFSVRNTMRRRLAEDPALLAAIGEEFFSKARAGDRDGTATLATLVDQVEGKPKETIAHELPAAPIIHVIKSGDMPPKPPE